MMASGPVVAKVAALDGRGPKPRLQALLQLNASLAK